MVSYEVSIGLILVAVVLCAGSLDLTTIIEAQEKSIWYVVPLFPLFIMFFISCLAETNRSPFDLPEAEAELVAGFNTEYSSMGFSLFFLGEYSSMIFMSIFTSILFLGGWLSPMSFLPVDDAGNHIFDSAIVGLVEHFNNCGGTIERDLILSLKGVLGGLSGFWLGIKTCLFLFIFIWVRASLPRYRYDQLMRLGWKVFLPISLGAVIFVACIIFCFNGHLVPADVECIPIRAVWNDLDRGMVFIVSTTKD